MPEPAGRKGLRSENLHNIFQHRKNLHLVQVSPWFENQSLQDLLRFVIRASPT